MQAFFTTKTRMERSISRSVVNRICSSILPIPALDPFSSEAATRTFRERLRKQLTGKKLVETEENILELIEFVNRRQIIASVKDYTYIGQQSAGSMYGSIAQSSQDAFKAVGDKKKVISSVVGSMTAAVSTVKDRHDQKVIVHFDQNYSKFANFSLEEAVAMRSIFVSSVVGDLIKKEEEIGVMKEFEGDGVSKQLRKLRNLSKERYAIQDFEPESRNKTAAKIKSGDNFKKSILTMRFFFDHAELYSRSLTMMDVIDAFKNVSGKYDMSICASSISKGIVDICVQSEDPEENSRVDEENVALDRIKDDVLKSHIGGIQGVNHLAVNVENLTNMYSVSRPHKYTLADLGKKRWMEENDIEDQSMEIYIRKLDDGVEEGDYIIGNLYYVPFDNQFDIPSDDEITEGLANYYINELGFKDIENVWVIELRVFKMKALCIDYESQIERLFNYCGLDIHMEYHELMDLPYYVYTYSKRNPSDVIKKVLNEAIYNRLPKYARDMIRTYAGNEDDMQKFYSENKKEIVDRITKYVYVTLSVDSKGTGKKSSGKFFNKNPFDSHVTPHAYTKIIKFPFVDRYKTTCNDWHTMTYTLGADCARNNYAEEFYRITDAASNADPRHIELFCDVVFEKGFPAGTGYDKSHVHEAGSTTQLSEDKQKAQFAASFNKGPENIKNVDVATFFGSPPISKDSRRKEIEYNTYLENLERERALLRVKGASKLADAEKSLELSVKAMYMAADPFNVSDDVTDKVEFEMTEKFEDFSTYGDEYKITGVEDILASLKQGTAEWRDKLREYKPYVSTKKRTFELTEASGIINISPLLEYISKLPINTFL